MNTPDTPDAQAILEQLQSLSEGLLFLSEQRYPFKVRYYPKPTAGQDIPALVAQILQVPADTKVEVVELSYFFRNHIKAEPEDQQTAERFRQLQDNLEQQLQQVKDTA